jgi:hypothetical protein
MPNMFVFNGPGSPVGNGSVVPAIETEGEYMIQCIDKIMKHDVKSMCIKEAAVDEFALHSDAWMPRMVSRRLSGCFWLTCCERFGLIGGHYNSTYTITDVRTSCRSWYKVGRAVKINVRLRSRAEPHEGRPSGRFTPRYAVATLRSTSSSLEQARPTTSTARSARRASRTTTTPTSSRSAASPTSASARRGRRSIWARTSTTASWPSGST